MYDYFGEQRKSSDASEVPNFMKTGKVPGFYMPFFSLPDLIDSWKKREWLTFALCVIFTLVDLAINIIGYFVFILFASVLLWVWFVDIIPKLGF